MSHPKQRIVVDAIDFSSLFLFPRILNSVFSALQPPRLLLALFLVASLVTLGRLWDAASAPTVTPAGLAAGPVTDDYKEALQSAYRRVLFVGSIPSDKLPPLTETDLTASEVRSILTSHLSSLSEPTDAQRAAITEGLELLETARPRGTFEGLAAHVQARFGELLEAALDVSPRRMIAAGGALALETPRALWRVDRAFTILYGLATLVLVALFGGALCRMAVCQFAAQERLSMRQALDFALGNASRLILALALPLGAALIIALVLVLFGVLFWVPWVDVIGALAYGVALALGFALAFLLLGFAAGFHMILPSVAAENADAPDAVQRAYSYVYLRPLHLVFYLAVAAIGLGLGSFVVSLFATLVMDATAILTGVISDSPALAAAVEAHANGAGHHVPQETAHHSATATVLGFWRTLITSLVAAWVLSYVFHASSAVYLLMRKACDGQDVDEVWRPGYVPGTMAAMPDSAAHRVVAATFTAATAVRYGTSAESPGSASSSDGGAPA